jgi:membrane protein
VKAFLLARRTIESFGRNYGTLLAAAIAYYALLSVFPLILGLIALLGVFFTDPSVRQSFVSSMANLFPGSEPLIEQTVTQVMAGRGPAGIVATLGLIWAASGVFSSFSVAMDRIWTVEETRNPILAAVHAVALVLAVALIFLVSLFLSTGLRVAADLGVRVVGMAPSALPYLVTIFGIAVPLAITFAIICLIYALTPNRALVWSQIWPGALIAAIFFEIGKQLFAWYLSTFANYNAVYGSVGAVIALVTWVYYAAIVLLLGAQLNAMLSEDVLPRDGAKALPLEPRSESARPDGRR